MQSFNLLVIEDDVDFSDSLRCTLHRSGHVVTVCHNWLSAMREINSQHFDYIISDIQTPTGNGLTAVGFLCQDEAVRQIPKVFVTGLKDAETIRQCATLNAAYLPKGPQVFEEITALVNALQPIPVGEAIS